ncbi:hypothetical protein D3C73_773600 [compost metagenome]
MCSLQAGKRCIQTAQRRGHPLKLGLKLSKPAIQRSQACTDFFVACQQRCVGIGQLLGTGRRLGQPRFDLPGSRGAAFDAALDARQAVAQRIDAFFQLSRAFCQLRTARYGFIQLRLVPSKLLAGFLKT